VNQLSWFDLFRKEQETTTILAQKQITKAIATVTELKDIMVAFSEGKSSEAEEHIEKLFENEVEIDDIRRTILYELTKQKLPSKYRQNVIHIIKCLDVLADHVKDSARNVKVLLGTKIPKEILDVNVRIVDALVQAAVFLSTAIEMIGVNPPQSLEFSKKVDAQEHIVDEEYLKVKALFLKYSDKVDMATLLVLKDLLECLEKIADTCADTADYIRVLRMT
jgi:predicted phosphate transport protein (TIGR00153 family)